MNNFEKSSSIMSGIVANDFTQRFTERTYRIFDDADQLSNLADKWKNLAADKAQGHMFEQLETIKFNLDAMKKDSELFAKTTASMGLPTDPVDVVISNGKKIIREVQAKSCNSAARSGFALSQEKYKEMMRLAPSDQHARIEDLLKKRIESGTLKSEEYEQTLRNLKKSLEHDGVSSGGTTYQEALDATSQAAADCIGSKFKINATLSDMHESGKRAGYLSAGVGGGFEAVSEAYLLFKGEREVGEVAVNVIVSSGKGYATGYAVTALSKGVTHAASHYLGEGLARSLSRSSAPVALAAGVVNASKSMVSFLRGDIDFERLTDEISHTAITSTSSFYYGGLGQVLIPIPVVGALIGAGVGYFIGNLIHQSGLVALGDSAIVKEAKERRRQIEAMCLAAIPQIQKNREEFEKKINLYFSDRVATFKTAFENIDLGLNDWDPDQCLEGLDMINEKFGHVLPFKNFKQFDVFMKSEEVFEF